MIEDGTDFWRQSRNIFLQRQVAIEQTIFLQPVIPAFFYHVKVGFFGAGNGFYTVITAIACYTCIICDSNYYIYCEKIASN